MLIVILPWPPRALSPNVRTHWAALAKAKKTYRETCAWTAKLHGASPMQAERLHLTLEFVPPSRRAFDLDNALASCKAGLDGLADVLDVDDSRWSLTIRKAPAGEIGGMVKVRITKDAG